jgi:hypothetical protein
VTGIGSCSWSCDDDSSFTGDGGLERIIGLLGRSTNSSARSCTTAGGSADREGRLPDINVGDRGPLPEDESLIAIDNLSFPAISLEDPATLAFDFRREDEPDAPRMCRLAVTGETELERGWERRIRASRSITAYLAFFSAMRCC